MNRIETPDWLNSRADGPLTGEEVYCSNDKIWWKSRGAIFCLKIEDDWDFTSDRIQEAENPEEVRAAVEAGNLYWVRLQVTAYRNDGGSKEIGFDSVSGVGYRCADRKERNNSAEYIARLANELADDILTRTRRQSDELVG